MKEFVTAVEAAINEDEATANREARIEALVEQYRNEPREAGTPEPTEERLRRRAAEQVADEEDDPHVDFILDGRQMRAYNPEENQLAFMISAMGRGQSQEQRFADILNLLGACLRQEDQDYLDARMLSRDKKDRKIIESIESVFEYLMEEWFEDHPTQQ